MHAYVHMGMQTSMHTDLKVHVHTSKAKHVHACDTSMQIYTQATCCNKAENKDTGNFYDLLWAL